ncbi:FAD-binding protein [Nocardia sp. CA-290969]|uniref:FAD-binding protein n=1 Tax=Nocardia sp. CA-290969 TaxID=3239986 RepID=UPI003D93E085
MSWVDSAVEWDERCEVLVLGSGGGGLTGAYTAGREGLQVIVAEATDRFGGTTAYSGGGMWFPGNPVLRRAGDDDTAENALEYFRAVVGDRTPAELQRAFVTGGAPLVEYLEQDPALRFQVLPWPDYFGNAPYARSTGRHIIPVPLHAEALGELAAEVRAPLATDRRSAPVPEQLEGGRALIGRLLLALRALPTVELKRRAACRELIRLDGRVVGASVSTPQGLRRIRATHGVLVAAGGFERNSRMRTTFGVPNFARDSMSPSGNTGAAIEAAMGVGADVDLMNEAWWAPGLTHPDGSSTFSMWFTGGILVDSAGRRFTNESAPYDRVGRDVLAAMDSGRIELPYWMIYSGTPDLAPPVLFAGIPLDDHEAYRAAGLWHRADTLAELAELIGVPAQTLTETVQRFNAAVDAGTDPDFDRGGEPYDRSVPGSPNPLVRIDGGPYCAAAFGLSDLGTKGGLRTDTAARVLDSTGAVIPGLYAAGNSMAAVSGTAYPGGGNPIGASMVFAHLAALDMAAATGLPGIPATPRSEPSPGEFKSALSRFCSGVTIVTAIGEDGPVGFSCQSFTSLSLEPPYVSFCPAATSTSWPRIRAAGRFCVNILAADQDEVCRAFARSGTDKFAGVEWTPGGNGAPALAGSLVSLECTLEEELPGGDHTIVIARVTAVGPVREAAPLLFYRSSFRELASEPVAAGAYGADTWRWG